MVDLTQGAAVDDDVVLVVPAEAVDRRLDGRPGIDGERAGAHGGTRGVGGIEPQQPLVHDGTAGMGAARVQHQRARTRLFQRLAGVAGVAGDQGGDDQIVCGRAIGHGDGQAAGLPDGKFGARNGG
ncbi:MAG: hypothetical protein U1F87_00175 [Kiritimatiellia bacterium]